jgi:site-specific DNA-methyltransferase (adenine-specific)
MERCVLQPYYEHAGITIYHGDCRDVLEEWEGLRTQSFDLLLTDPPYGIHWVPRVNHRDGPWKDTERILLAPWLAIARKACVWGGNYYTAQLSASESWLIWLKRPAGFDDDPRTYATLEMAWTNYGGKPKHLTHVWDGGKRQGESINRGFIHPAQKPVEVMRWAILQSGIPCGRIIDPFMGSGTTLEAAKRLGHQATGIEREERYCEIAAQRLQQEALPLSLEA